MKVKEENITLIPVTKNSYAGKALNTHVARSYDSIARVYTGKTEHGWLDIPSEGLGLWMITNWHSFDDFGATIDTLTVQRLGVTKEVYSFDEGETFTLESGE